MEKVTLTAVKRMGQVGKGKARSIRRDQHTPGILYDDGGSIPIMIATRDLSNLMKTHGQHAIFSLNLDGSNRQVVIKELQRNAVNHHLIHFDLQPISMDETMQFNIPIQVAGMDMIEGKGGIIQRQLQEIEIEALPDDIPKSINIDISNLDFGDSFQVHDIPSIEGVTILSNPDEVILTIAESRLQDEAVEQEEVIQEETADE